MISIISKQSDHEKSLKNAAESYRRRRNPIQIVSVEWVEIIEPSRREHMFANLKTGQCLWDPPHGVSIKPTHENQWWELFDTNTSRYYYYNATSQKTVWRQPSDGDIISLTKLQMLKAKEVTKNNTQNASIYQNNGKHSIQDVDQQISVNDDVRKANIAMDISLSSNEFYHQEKHSLNISNKSSDDHASLREIDDDDTEVVYENYIPKETEDKKVETVHPVIDSEVTENEAEVEEEEVVYENLSIQPPIGGVLHKEKSTTLPRKSYTDKTVEKPKFNSFRSKAPPKPPRSVKQDGHSSVDKLENKESDKENLYANGYNISVQSSPRMKTRSTAKPIKTPSQVHRNEPEKLELMTANDKVVPQDSQPLSKNVELQQPLQVHNERVVSDVLHTDQDKNLSGSSDDNITPSGTLLRGESVAEARTSFYERFNNEEDGSNVTNQPSQNISNETGRTTPVKRSPLTRMKSDSSDLEKRPRFSKSLDTTQFRPVSMLNLSAANTQMKAKRLSSESDIPEDVPLTTHRKGLFRRRMSIHSMLSWSKTPIKKPMVMTRDKQKRKEAVEVFKLILQCMGDKSSRKNRDTLSVEITGKGWSSPHLRDEIYIQLCKQTTANDKPTSLRRGWELITACLSIFPPSTKFQSYLEGYIYRNMDAEVVNTQADVNTYAKYCYKQLERICQTGAKRGLKGPTIDEINAAIKRVFNPSMFGNSLEDIMDMQKERFPDHRLPWILTTLTDAVLLHNGLQTEGIFRVPGDIDEVNSLKLEVDRWQLPQNLTEPHIPASLLKLWFRDLYEPLIPQRFYDQCIHNSDNPDVCLNIVKSLPPLNNLVFSYLIRLLQAFMIPENVGATKMDENNLAMVWAPNCLRCPSDDPREIFENTRKEMTFLRTAMKCLDTAFLQGVV